MSVRNRKTDNVRYGDIKQVRLTMEMGKQVKAIAFEQNTSESEIIRQAVINYINRNMNDAEIVHACLNELKRNIQVMSDKIELLALIIMQQTKHLLKVLHDNSSIDEDLLDLSVEEFQRKCLKTLKTNHIGLLESMLLDFYEKGDNEENDN